MLPSNTFTFWRKANPPQTALIHYCVNLKRKEKSGLAPVNGHQMKWTGIVLLRPVAPWIKQTTLTERTTLIRDSDLLHKKIKLG